MPLPILAVNGLSAVGKKDLGEGLARYYNVERISIGNFCRDLAKKQGITLEKLNELASEDSRCDRKVHESVAAFIFRCTQEQRGCIIEGYCSAHIVRDICPDALAVFLSCEPYQRYIRIQQRKGNQQKIIGAISNAEMLGEHGLSARMSLYYGKTLQQLLKPSEDFDICIETTHMNKEQVLHQARGELEKRGY